jgi:hypothetical protein
LRRRLLGWNVRFTARGPGFSRQKVSAIRTAGRPGSTSAGPRRNILGYGISTAPVKPTPDHPNHRPMTPRNGRCRPIS